MNRLKSDDMTNEEKQLLLVDLCARLVYGIFVKENRDSIDNDIVIYTIDYHPCINNCKPYLRPMSSMTKEEKVEYDSFNAPTAHRKMWVNRIDWLLSNHFDFRGLIPMGLALEAPKDIYKFD